VGPFALECKSGLILSGNWKDHSKLFWQNQDLPDFGPAVAGKITAMTAAIILQFLIR
jgi:hypothetical protein